MWGPFHVADSNMMKTNITNNTGQEEYRICPLSEEVMFLFDKLCSLAGEYSQLGIIYENLSLTLLIGGLSLTKGIEMIKEWTQFRTA